MPRRRAVVSRRPTVVVGRRRRQRSGTLFQFWRPTFHRRPRRRVFDLVTAPGRRVDRSVSVVVVRRRRRRRFSRQRHRRRSCTRSVGTIYAPPVLH